MSSVKRSQQCPICGSVQPLPARTCSICGAVLPGQPASVTPLVTTPTEPKARFRYDPLQGDDDLYADDLTGRMWRLVTVGLIVLALVVGVGIGLAINQLGDDENPNSGVRAEWTEPVEGASTQTPDDGRPTAPPTSTPRDTPFWVEMTKTGTLPAAAPALPTVTPAPPTDPPPTETPTPGPCVQVAKQGDTLFDLAMRCGHVDWAVIDLILEMNGMESAAQLQINQSVQIPWPTPGPVETSVPEGDTGEDAGAMDMDQESTTTVSEIRYNEFGTPDALAKYEDVEPTLRPGQAWYVVQPGETIIDVAYIYETNVEVLSQINPEVPFLQCDFGMQYGGPNCSVMLYENQRIRVPVPLPTQTPIPSPVGTLTPTPTATPTYNAPFTLGPEDGVHFYADEKVSLRWGGTGTLGENEWYLVRVRDLDTGQAYLAPTTDTTYVLPGGWQPGDRNTHTFEWTVSIVTLDEDFSILTEDHVSDPRQFTWDSR